MRFPDLPTSASRGRFGHSVLWLVVGSALPLILFGAITAWTVVQQRTAAITQELKSTTNTLMVAVDRELADQLHAMAILATDPTLDGDNAQAFNQRASRALLANPDWSSIGLIELDSTKIVAGAPEVPEPAPFSLSPRHVMEVRQSQKPVIAGAFAKGRLAAGPVILLMVPVVRSSSVKYVIGVTMKPKALNDLFIAQGMQPTWTAAVLDAEMVIAGRSRDADRFIGVRATPTLEQKIKSSVGEMFTAVNQEGATVHTIFRRSGTTGWAVVIGVPAADVQGPVLATLQLLVGAGIVLILLPLGIALVFGRSLAAQRKAYEAELHQGHLDRDEALNRLHKIADNVPGVVFQFLQRPDGSSCFPYASDAIRSIYRVTPEEVVDNADEVFANIHPDDLSKVADAIHESATLLEPWQQEYRVKFKDGATRWVSGHAVPQPEKDGSVLWHGFITDVTDRKDAESRMLQSEQKFGLILESAADAIFIADQQGHYQFVNVAASELLGYSRETLLGMSIPDIAPKDELPDMLMQFQTLLGQGFLQTEFQLVRRDGSLVPVAFNGAVLPDGNIFGSCRDITQRRLAEEKLRETTLHLQTIIQYEPECIMILDAVGRLRQMNPAGLTMVEADAWADVEATPMRNLIAPDHRLRFSEMHEKVMRGEPSIAEFEIIGLKGSHRWIETHGVPMQEKGSTVHLAVARDISQRRDMEAQVRQLAFHDALTGLPNRRLFSDRLMQSMATSARSGKYAAVLFLDLDNFKPINDLHGHEAGDALLEEVANRLTQAVRAIDTVARFGGDEFVVLLDGLHTDEAPSTTQAMQIAEKLRSILSEPYAIVLKNETDAGRTVLHRCTACIGVAVFLDHHNTVDDVLKHADDAMYQAKNAGRNAVRVFGQ